MKDSTARALRTGLDVVPAILAAVLVLVPVLGLSAATVASVSAVVGAITVALTKIRNAAEDAGLIPAVAKSTPDEAVDPDAMGGAL